MMLIPISALSFEESLVELSPDSANFQDCVNLGLPLVSLVRTPDELIAGVMPDNGWYQIGGGISAQDMHRMFPDAAIQYFLRIADQRQTRVNPNYRPQKLVQAIEYEKKVAHALAQYAGLSPDIVAAIPGYTPAQIPFVYGTSGHKVTSGSPDKYYLQELTSILWMGTIVPVEDLKGYHLDQITGVRVQWWGHIYPDGEHRYRRLEITPAKNGVFVHREYREVSAMGAFDGELRVLSIHTPIDNNWVFDGKPRRDWRIHYAELGGTIDDPAPYINMRYTNVSGVTVLNALQQLMAFHRGEVQVVKYVAPAADEFYFEEGDAIQVPLDFYKA